MVPTVRVDEFPKTSGSQFHLLRKMRTPEYSTSRPKISDFTNLRFISPCRTQLWDENCLSGGCCFQCLSLTMLDVRWSCTKDFDMPTVTPLFPEAAPIAPPMIPAAPPSRWLPGNRRKAHPCNHAHLGARAGLTSADGRVGACRRIECICDDRLRSAANDVSISGAVACTAHRAR